MKTNKKDSLGDRMKMYESVSKSILMHKTPVIIRIDGKAFHTFTRGFKRPFDEILIKSMQETTKYLCENIQGCVFGYTQSDEITLVLCDYQTYDTDCWYDYEVQKLCSISASMATMKFNQIFSGYVAKAEEDYLNAWNNTKEDENLIDTYRKAADKGAMFDSRCFNVQKDEVVNCVIWRQQDAERNSVQMVGQYYFSHSELQKKSCNMIQDMLFTQKGVNWNDFPVYQKRGTAIIKRHVDNIDKDVWVIDKQMPILTQDRDYLESLINFD